MATVSIPSEGDHPFSLLGREMIADADGVLVWPDAGLVAVADLHLEKGSSFAARGSLLPPYDTAATLDRLEHALRRWKPRRVLCLGDSFHDRAADGRLGDDERTRLTRLCAEREWYWIAGNHDPDPPEGVGGATAAEMIEDGVTFRHRASAAPPDFLDGLEVSGHWHPAAVARTRAGRVRARCFLIGGRRLILPAFGAYTGGLNVLDPAMAALVDPPTATAILIRDRRTHRFPVRDLVPDGAKGGGGGRRARATVSSAREKTRRVGGNPSGAK